ncbi:hypothetical protein [Jiella pelagia]|uniref:Uncharacterized protein n=1 Tax=Jiella pelagia TaxID=2986949 RepID=A0ABY7C106_9HYPH|nr:hypothetical protein [Jiella pelagia]WAP69383.1 hypothetical protein OH818_03615 [Jiella pelagia]
MKFVTAVAAAVLFAASAFAQTGSGNADSSSSTEESPTTSGSPTDCAANPTAPQCGDAAKRGNSDATVGATSTDQPMNSDMSGSTTAASGQSGNGADTTSPAVSWFPDRRANECSRLIASLTATASVISRGVWQSSMSQLSPSRRSGLQ